MKKIILTILFVLVLIIAITLFIKSTSSTNDEKVQINTATTTSVASTTEDVAEVKTELTPAELEAIGEPTKTFTSKELGIAFKYYEEYGTPKVEEFIGGCGTKEYYEEYQKDSYPENNNYYLDYQDKIDSILGQECVRYEVTFNTDDGVSLLVLAVNEFEAQRSKLPRPDTAGVIMSRPPTTPLKLADSCPDADPIVWCSKISRNPHGIVLGSVDTFNLIALVPHNYAYGFYNSKTDFGIAFVLGEYLSAHTAERTTIVGDYTNLTQRAMLDKVVETIEFVE